MARRPARAVVHRRTRHPPRLKLDFARRAEESLSLPDDGRGDILHVTRPGSRKHVAVPSLTSGKPCPMRNRAMPQRGGELLSVANAPRLGKRHAARCDKHLIRPHGETARRDDEAVLHRLYACDRAVGKKRYFAVAQKIAEHMHDIGGLLARREKASVRTAFYAQTPCLEPCRNHRGRTPLQRGLDKRGDGLSDVGKHALRGDVLREVAAPVRRHQHLGADARLALEHKASDPQPGGSGGGEETGGASAYYRKGNRPVSELWSVACHFRRYPIPFEMRATAVDMLAISRNPRLNDVSRATLR